MLHRKMCNSMSLRNVIKCELLYRFCVDCAIGLKKAPYVLLEMITQH